MVKRIVSYAIVLFVLSIIGLVAWLYELYPNITAGVMTIGLIIMFAEMLHAIRRF